MSFVQTNIPISERLATRGLTLQSLTFDMIPSICNLAQINADGKMSDSDKIRMYNYLSGLCAIGKLAGCSILNSQRMLVACGCLESGPVFDGSTSYHMCSVHVHPKYRRTGLGKAVVETLIAFAQSHNGGEIILNVTNPNARALYEQYGFRDNGYRGLHDNAVMMTLQFESVPVRNFYGDTKLPNLSFPELVTRR